MLWLKVLCLTIPSSRRNTRVKTHAGSVVQPGFDYFAQKFHPMNGGLAHQMKLLKLARLCNSARWTCLLQRSKRGSTNCVAATERWTSLVSCASFWHLFKSHSHEIPAWAQLASLLATQLVSLAAVERVFSFLKNAFKETQEKALSDYALSFVIQRYNNRRWTFIYIIEISLQFKIYVKYIEKFNRRERGGAE